METELDKGTGSSSAATAWTRPSRAMQSAGQSSSGPKKKKTRDREQEASGAARERCVLGTGRPGWSRRALEALRRSFTSAGVKWGAMQALQQRRDTFDVCF